MRSKRLRIAVRLVALWALAAVEVPSFLAAQAAVPTDQRAIVHVLNRLGYGARPGDVERVRAIGLETYINRQLRPERIEDPLVTELLGLMPSLEMTTRELADKYYLPALMERRARQREQAADDRAPRSSEEMQTGPDRSPDPGGARRRSGEAGMRRLAGMPLSELTQQKILRAIHSERQLEEVMVDFWFNHFNVFAGKGVERLFLTEYERDVIRPNALGNFRQLLGAVAESPAMLFYLDNWLSADPSAAERMSERRRQARMGGNRGPARRRLNGAPDGDQGDTSAQPQRVRRPPRRAGLNENYARELMELHTLGVDGGYSQKDVVEVARAFTGWTIAQPRQGGAFRFEPRLHDNAEKVVLGHRIKGGGKREGEMVLDILAKHPSTARFIATKLARRFVSDEPPPELVERAARRFSASNGDIREVVRAIVSSPEFFSPAAYRAKVKTPLELVASAVRVTGAEVTNALALAQTLRQLGMPLYFAQPPTGYPDRAEAWVNTGALLNRMNFALALVGNQLRGVRVDVARVAGSDDLEIARQRLVSAILQNDASQATRDTLQKGSGIRQIAALSIGAPEFQRR